MTMGNDHGEILGINWNDWEWKMMARGGNGVMECYEMLWNMMKC